MGHIWWGTFGVGASAPQMILIATAPGCAVVGFASAPRLQQAGGTAVVSSRVRPAKASQVQSLPSYLRRPALRREDACRTQPAHRLSRRGSRRGRAMCNRWSSSRGLLGAAPTREGCCQRAPPGAARRGGMPGQAGVQRGDNSGEDEASQVSEREVLPRRKWYVPSRQVRRSAGKAQARLRTGSASRARA